VDSVSENILITIILGHRVNLSIINWLYTVIVGASCGGLIFTVSE
jgi:hypothetical protein